MTAFFTSTSVFSTISSKALLSPYALYKTAFCRRDNPSFDNNPSLSSIDACASTGNDEINFLKTGALRDKLILPLSSLANIDTSGSSALSARACSLADIASPPVALDSIAIFLTSTGLVNSFTKTGFFIPAICCGSMPSDCACSIRLCLYSAPLP